MSKGKVLLVLYEANENARKQPKMLGCLENELGIRELVESAGYELVKTSNKDPEGSSEVDEYLKEAEIIITTPFWPTYVTKERMAKAPNLKMCITAGVGSDHVDLNTANERKITVTEVTGSNVQSVAEHAVMTMLVLVRNFIPSHQQALDGGWDIGECAKYEYDLEGKVIATVGAGRIGFRILERLVAFNPKKLLYYDYQDLPKDAVKKLNDASKLFNGVDNIVERVENLEDMVSQADIVTINCPLHENSKGLFNKDLISKMKKGAYIVNTARGAIAVKEDVAAALKSGQLGGYGGDVWDFQPAPKDHPWRSMDNGDGAGNAMTTHVSGTSLDAQKRYADGVKSILTSYFTGKHDYRPQDVIVINGDYATKSYGQC
jgi:formate dehydrogenase